MKGTRRSRRITLTGQMIHVAALRSCWTTPRLLREDGFFVQQFWDSWALLEEALENPEAPISLWHLIDPKDAHDQYPQWALDADKWWGATPLERGTSDYMTDVDRRDMRPLIRDGALRLCEELQEIALNREWVAAVAEIRPDQLPLKGDGDNKRIDLLGLTDAIDADAGEPRIAWKADIVEVRTYRDCLTEAAVDVKRKQAREQADELLRTAGGVLYCKPLSRVSYTILGVKQDGTEANGGTPFVDRRWRGLGG